LPFSPPGIVTKKIIYDTYIIERSIRFVPDSAVIHALQNSRPLPAYSTYPIHYNYKTIKKTKMIKKQFDSIQVQSLLLYNF